MSEYSIVRESTVKNQRVGKTYLLVPLLLFGSVAISYYIIIPGVSLAQLIWALTVAVILSIHPLASRSVFSWFVAFVLFALVSTLAGLACLPTFGYVEAIKSCANLLFYFGCTVVLVPYLRQYGYERLTKTVSLIIVFLSIAAFIQYIYVVGFDGASTIYVWPNHFAGNPLGADLRGHFRAAGIFGEPSYLGLYIVVFMSFIVIQPPKKWPIGTIAIGILAILVSFSAGAFVMIIVLFLLQLPRVIGKIMASRRTRSMVLALLFLGLVVVVTPARTVIRDIVVERLSPSSLIEEGSFRDRLLGSWELSTAAVRQSPVIGVGLGNLEPFHKNIAEELKYKAQGSDTITSTFAWVLGTTGVIGMILFLYPVLQTFRKTWHRYGLMVYFTVFWLWFILLSGMFLAVPFWLFLTLGLSILPMHENAQRQGECGAKNSSQ